MLPALLELSVVLAVVLPEVELAQMLSVWQQVSLVVMQAEPLRTARAVAVLVELAQTHQAQQAQQVAQVFHLAHLQVALTQTSSVLVAVAAGHQRAVRAAHLLAVQVAQTQEQQHQRIPLRAVVAVLDLVLAVLAVQASFS